MTKEILVGRTSYMQFFKYEDSVVILTDQNYNILDYYEDRVWGESIRQIMHVRKLFRLQCSRFHLSRLLLRGKRHCIRQMPPLGKNN